MTSLERNINSANEIHAVNLELSLLKCEVRRASEEAARIESEIKIKQLQFETNMKKRELDFEIEMKTAIAEIKMEKERVKLYIMKKKRRKLKIANHHHPYYYPPSGQVPYGRPVAAQVSGYHYPYYYYPPSGQVDSRHGGSEQIAANADENEEFDDNEDNATADNGDNATADNGDNAVDESEVFDATTDDDDDDDDGKKMLEIMRLGAAKS